MSAAAVSAGEVMDEFWRRRSETIGEVEDDQVRDAGMLARPRPSSITKSRAMAPS